jgi:hypothetical protein
MKEKQMILQGLCHRIDKKKQFNFFFVVGGAVPSLSCKKIQEKAQKRRKYFCLKIFLRTFFEEIILKREPTTFPQTSRFTIKQWDPTDNTSLNYNKISLSFLKKVLLLIDHGPARLQ